MISEKIYSLPLYLVTKYMVTKRVGTDEAPYTIGDVTPIFGDAVDIFADEMTEACKSLAPEGEDEADAAWLETLTWRDLPFVCRVVRLDQVDGRLAFVTRDALTAVARHRAASDPYGPRLPLSMRLLSEMLDRYPEPTRKTTDWAALHAKGLTAREAAKEAGKTEEAARIWAARRGVSWAGATTRQPADWAALHAQGLSARLAALKANRATEVAYRWARRNGVTWAAEARKRGADKNTDWAALHKKGLTARQAAEAAGLTYNAAYAWARRRGIKWASFAPVQEVRQ